MRSVRKSVRGALALLAVISGSACTVLGIETYGEERDQLEDARGLWQSRGWDSYAFTLQRLCFCAGGTTPAEVVVLAGARVSVTEIATGQPIPSEFARLYLTVPELFDFIEDALDREAHEIEVRYDRAAGYPVSIRIDYIRNAIDEEMAFEASSLRALR